MPGGFIRLKSFAYRIVFCLSEMYPTGFGKVFSVFGEIFPIGLKFSAGYGKINKKEGGRGNAVSAPGFVYGGSPCVPIQYIICCFRSTAGIFRISKRH